MPRGLARYFCVVTREIVDSCSLTVSAISRSVSGRIATSPWSKNARCRALQLPAWNEALGLPRPWDQQWSLRMQQVLAYESDLLEYDDLFTGSVVVEAKVAELVAGARAEMARVAELGGAVAAVEGGYMKSELVASHALRRQRIEAGEDIVVGVNKFETTEPNPLTADLDTAIQTVDAGVESAAAKAVKDWRERRDDN